MDWSLVLASQGIDGVIIDRAEADGGWGLIVAAKDYAHALKALRQYQLENRHWPWRQTLPRSKAHFDWGSVAWIFLLGIFYWVSSVHVYFQNVGIMDSTAVATGQWWRVFTAMMLHADIAHLLTNLSMGIVLLGLAMGRFGTGLGLLAAYLAGACGNVASLTLNAKPFYGLGASGMIMGALGLLTAQSLSLKQAPRISEKCFLGALVAGVMLFLLLGLSPGSDLVAHLGGFVAGLILGITLSSAPARLLQSPKLNLLAGLAVIAFVLFTWWQALH
jgi:membrane associated rhomboid family serine protease